MKDTPRALLAEKRFNAITRVAKAKLALARSEQDAAQELQAATCELQALNLAQEHFKGDVKEGV